jgi:phage terminase large subunit-like protein
VLIAHYFSSFCSWPRRNGKTTACSDGACAIVLKTPAVDVVCFAPTLRQAKQIMDQCRHTMKNHPDFKDFIIIQDQAECIKIKGPDGTIRSLTALPSTHKVIMRGGGGEWRETKQCVCVCPLAVMFSQ